MQWQPIVNGRIPPISNATDFPKTVAPPAAGKPSLVAMQAAPKASGDALAVDLADPRIRFSGGPVSFTQTHFTVDGETHPLANTVATPGQIAQAGTRDVPASDGHADHGELILQGPLYGTKEATSKRPGFFGGMLQRLMVRFNFGRADNWQNRLRLREAPIVDFDRLDGATNNALVKQLGMRAGDFILVGDQHCGHLQVYVGDDAKTGEPQIVHSMATKYENKSFRIWARVLLEIAFSRLVLWRRLDKTGVFQEGFGEYLDRNATGSAIMMRDPRLTDAMREHLVKLVLADRGKDYNGNLIETGNRVYCSQLLVKNILATYAAFGVEPPRVNTCLVHHAKGKFYEMRAYVATPENVSVCPDFTVLGYSGNGRNDLIQNLKAMVRPDARR